jgi:hypothetical protein
MRDNLLLSNSLGICHLKSKKTHKLTYAGAEAGADADEDADADTVADTDADAADADAADADAVVDAIIENSFLESLAAWKNSSEAYLAAVRVYMDETGDSGLQIVGIQWSVAQRALESAEELFRNIVIDGGRVAELMATGDAIECTVRLIDTAADIALNPNVQASVLVGMSRTYSENLNRFRNNILEAEVAVKAQHSEAIASASRAGAHAGARLTVEAITSVYNEKPNRGGLATVLYVSTLLYLASIPASGPAALRQLEAAKDLAFGIAPDSPAAAAADTAALAEYHPLQTMTYTPVAFGPPHEPDGNMTDLGLPQARLAVTYDLTPLIDRKRALAHGPLANTITGLNFRLIERLRTIHVEPYLQQASSCQANILVGPRVGTMTGPLLVTTNGLKARTVAPPPGGGPWAPFAGSCPRVAARTDAEATMILAAICKDHASGWGLDMSVQYGVAVKRKNIPDGNCSEAVLLAALTSEFEKSYDENPPKNPHDFRNLVVPEPLALNNYLTAAISRVSFDTLDEQLHALHTRSTRARVSHAVTVRETRITQAIHTVNAVRELRKRFKSFKEAYCPDLEAFTAPADKKKAVVLKAFHRIAIDAVRTSPLECNPPTLKWFAIVAS